MRATSIPAGAVPEFPELPTESLLEAYRRMTLIRVFEERVSELYRNSEVPGFVHLSIGQEAAAVGACWPLAVTDVITSNHRGHGHCLAKSLAPEPMMAELLARVTGTNKGLGGSMHIADPDLGIFGANGIVAAGVPIAGGAALAAKLRAGRDRAGAGRDRAGAGRDRAGKENSVVVSFFGDGAVAQGAFHETANLAALWRLPIVFFCENNGYAEFSPIADQHPVPMAARVGKGGNVFALTRGLHAKWPDRLLDTPISETAVMVMPSTPADTYGLLRSAILDPNPVVFIENRQQYGMKGPKPPADYLIPLGKAKVVREGTDITIVSVSRMVQEALAAAEALAPRGISAEVIDLRTVAPLDKETILGHRLRHRRRDRRAGRLPGLLDARRAGHAGGAAADAVALRAEPGEAVAARPAYDRARR